MEVFVKIALLFSSSISQKFKYLGFVFDTRSCKYSVPVDKIQKFEALVNSLSPSEQDTPKHIASIVGKRGAGKSTVAGFLSGNSSMFKVLILNS